MASKSDIRICAIARNQVSRIFSITERNNGDLVINLNPATYFRDAFTTHKQSDLKIRNQKYSIHCSNQSSSGINVIKQIIEYDDKTETITRHYTKAMKKTNQYAVLFTARTADLSLPHYAAKADSKNTVLTSYDTTKATLNYMVSVCNHQTEEIKGSYDYCHKYIDLKKFRILVIWSFFNIPTHSSGSKIHFLTLPPEDVPIDPSGFSHEYLIDFFRFMRKELKKEFETTLNKEFPSIHTDIFSEVFAFPETNYPLTKVQKQVIYYLNTQNK